MKTKQPGRRIIVFSCNWHAYNSLETAGKQGISYPSSVVPIRLSCLGRITPGMILKAFEQGAAGVFLMGCPPGDCHYVTGNQLVEQVFLETRSLLNLLGYRENQLQLDFLNAGDGSAFVENLQKIINAVEEPLENR